MTVNIPEASLGYTVQSLQRKLESKSPKYLSKNNSNAMINSVLNKGEYT